HCVMNEITTVNGNEATAKSYIVLARSKGKGALVNGRAGRYEDHLVKQGDRWMFKTRKVHFDLMGDMNKPSPCPCRHHSSVTSERARRRTPLRAIFVMLQV